MNHFNITVSEFRDWFQRIGMRVHDCWVDLCHFPALGQIAVSWVTLCLSLPEGDWFSAVERDFPSIVRGIYACRKCWCFITINFAAFCCSWGCVTFLLCVFHIDWNSIGRTWGCWWWWVLLNDAVSDAVCRLVTDCAVQVHANPIFFRRSTMYKRRSL